jgi:hypothetical protein
LDAIGGGLAKVLGNICEQARRSAIDPRMCQANATLIVFNQKVTIPLK